MVVSQNFKAEASQKHHEAQERGRSYIPSEKNFLIMIGCFYLFSQLYLFRLYELVARDTAHRPWNSWIYQD